MATQSPITDRHQDDDATLMPYGTPPNGALLVDTFGAPQAEYAAIRKGAGLIDLPHRAIVRAQGDDRLDFLERMLTQKLTGLTPGRSTNAFWINRNGRLIADLRVIVREEDILLELDALAASATIETLDAFLIMDDVTLENITDTHHRLALHGPRALDLLIASLNADLPDLPPNTNTTIDALDTTLTIDRADTTSETGLDLIVETDRALAVYDAITKAIEENPDLKARPIGWAAFNTARIEAGTPLFNIDFGEKSLPAETGVLESRVDFTKGCYPGQEIVARMRSLGGPKQQLVSLEFPKSTDDTPQPRTGDPIAATVEPDKSVGAITSSTRGPMLSGAIVCLAQVRTAHAEPGADLLVTADNSPIPAKVRDSLTAYSQDGALA